MDFQLRMMKTIVPDAEERNRYERLGFRFMDTFAEFPELGCEDESVRWALAPEYPTVSFSTLEELMAFIDKWGPCVIGKLIGYDAATGYVLIYNDY